MSTTSYSEDTIVQLVTELYTLLVDLAFIQPGDIKWPGDDGHAINETLCEELHIDPSVASLMKRLPYTNDRETAWEYHIFPSSRPYCYLEDVDIRDGRDPILTGTLDPPRLDYLLPYDVALSTGMGDGDAWVLDTHNNQIRLLDGTYDPPGPPGTIPEHLGSPELLRPERPDEPDHYRNYVPRDAVKCLGHHIEQIKSLELIPCGLPGSMGYYSDGYGELYQDIKTILTETYGWPAEFRRADWHRDMERVWEEVTRRH